MTEGEIMLEKYVGKRIIDVAPTVLDGFRWAYGLDFGESSFFMSLAVKEKRVKRARYLLDLYIDRDYNDRSRISKVYLQTNKVYRKYKNKSPEEVFSEEEKAEAEKFADTFLRIVTGKDPGKVLKYYREGMEWSKEQLADMLSISVDQVNQYEDGDIKLKDVKAIIKKVKHYDYDDEDEEW
ncbi:MAG: helix-turn-helix transcriptional regulator [Clostridia bacterium]|nr:helix-turn-helix transcriptional regulator [Clostridia bacterium]